VSLFYFSYDEKGKISKNKGEQNMIILLPQGAFICDLPNSDRTFCRIIYHAKIPGTPY
jgi:hypothetical protein